jgi:hypothetical protein
MENLNSRLILNTSNHGSYPDQEEEFKKWVEMLYNAAIPALEWVNDDDHQESLDKDTFKQLSDVVIYLNKLTSVPILTLEDRHTLYILYADIMSRHLYKNKHGVVRLSDMLTCCEYFPYLLEKRHPGFIQQLGTPDPTVKKKKGFFVDEDW